MGTTLDGVGCGAAERSQMLSFCAGCGDGDFFAGGIETGALVGGNFVEGVEVRGVIAAAEDAGEEAVAADGLFVLDAGD